MMTADMAKKILEDLMAQYKKAFEDWQGSGKEKKERQKNGTVTVGTNDSNRC